MRDGPVRHLLKLLGRALAALERAAFRLFSRKGGRPRFRLEGACSSCGRCCQEPSIRIGRLMRVFFPLRYVFLRWQERVNGFVYLRSEDKGWTLVFRCSHFDSETCRCDAYASRPPMCRSYPDVLLRQPWPELFDECGYRVVSTTGDEMLRALEEAGVSPEQQEELSKRLRLK